jgi:hypothetical protein
MESFIYFVLPMREKIMQRSEDFFLGNEFKQSITEKMNQMNKENIIQKSDNEITMMHNKISKMWKNDMTDEDKDVVWKYFQVMIVLSERYIQENI